MNSPSYLKKGDCVAIVATARKISREEMEPAIKVLEAEGYKVRIGETIGAEENQFAGSVECRVKDLQAVLDDDEVRAILCARGGYGTVQIIDKLNFSHFKQQPKWIIGYSDVTVLHAHIQQNFGIETLHATMPINFPKDGKNKSVEILLKALKGEQLEYKFSAAEKNKNLVKTGSAEGVLFGGNLSILYSLCGSKSFPNMDNKILFIEDLDEYLYHIDRMMMNLKRNGTFENLKGLIVGGMSDMNDNAIPYGKTAEEIIYENVKAYHFPVCFDFPAGHFENNFPLKLGAEIEMEITRSTSKIKFH